MRRHFVPPPENRKALLSKAPPELKAYVEKLEAKQVEMAKDVEGVVFIVYTLFEQTGINDFIRKEQEKAARYKEAGKDYKGPNFFQVTGKLMPMLNKGKDVFTNDSVQKFVTYIIGKYQEDVEQLTAKTENHE